MLVGVGLKSASLLASAEMMGMEIDYTSVIRWASRLTRMSINMADRGATIDRAMLDEMVTRAKASAPVRTGSLVNGITGEREGAEYVFRASAINPIDGVDYARLVEFGTKAGRRRHANDKFFASAERASRRMSRPEHPGTEAKPFFWPAARSVLQERRAKHAREIMSQAFAAGRDEG